MNNKGQVLPINNGIKEKIKQISKNLNKEGLRVIAVCQKNDIIRANDVIFMTRFVKMLTNNVKKMTRFVN